MLLSCKCSLQILGIGILFDMFLQILWVCFLVFKILNYVIWNAKNWIFMKSMLLIYSFGVTCINSLPNPRSGRFYIYFITWTFKGHLKILLKNGSWEVQVLETFSSQPFVFAVSASVDSMICELKGTKKNFRKFQRAKLEFACTCNYLYNIYIVLGIIISII